MARCRAATAAWEIERALGTITPIDPRN